MTTGASSIRRHRVAAAIVLLALAMLVGLPASAIAADIDPAIRQSIDELGSPNPRVRQKAAEAIHARGAAARPALVEAMESEQPQLRLAATELIVQLPFDDPDDSPAVREVLIRWGNNTVPNRVQAVRNLIAIAGPAQAPAILLRLINEDPAERVRWAIVSHFRSTPAWRTRTPRAAFLAAARDRAPNTALWGWAQEVSDPEAALRTYQRVLEMEAEHPSDDDGQSEFVFDTLYTRCMRQRRYDDAAHVLRVQHARSEAGVTTPHMRYPESKLDDLFYLHARFGPLKGFAQDLQAHAPSLSRPQVLYALGQMYERRGNQPLVADALYRAAWVSTAGSLADRENVAEFLLNHQMDTLATRELKSILSLIPADAGRGDVRFVNSHLRLGIIAARRADDFAAAEHMRLAMENLGSIPGRILTRTKGDRTITGKEAEDMVWAEIHWHYLRAARAKKDEREILRELDQLVTFAPDDDRIVHDVLPELVERGRGADAERLFAKPFATLKARLEEKPDDAERLNNLAWLCARADQKLDEARAWVARAIQQQPDNGAYLDTAAEVEFRLGHIDRAIALEKKALKLRPDDPFIEEQIKRFEAAKRK